MSEAASIVKHQPQSFEFTQEQSKMIRDSFLNGASEAEASVLMELARVRRLNPITRQIHFVKRWDNERSREVWSAQVGIDGFRAIAERTGKYEGQDEPEFEYDKSGAIRLCRVKIYRSDWTRPAVGVAHFTEYAQYKKDGSLTKMWASKGHIMIAKCAEALALRKAFPEDTSGLYTPEEMDQGEKDVTPPRPQAQQPAQISNGATTAALKAKVLAAVPKDQPATAALVQSMTETKPANEEEPPPPDDRDAPWQREPGDDDAEGPMGESAEVGAPMAFGTGKGKPLSELDDKSLSWYADALSANVADPAKARYKASNQEALAGIRREQQRRGK